MFDQNEQFQTCSYNVIGVHESSGHNRYDPSEQPTAALATIVQNA